MAAPAVTYIPRVSFICYLLLAAGLLRVAPACAYGEWKPVDPAELAATKSTIDPEAGAEILEKAIELGTRTQDAIRDHHYVRIKIYTAPGASEFSKVEIPYDDGVVIRWLEARTIKPDGTILELNPKEVFDREIFTMDQGRYHENLLSFALPGVEPGAIIEYAYYEDHEFWYAQTGEIHFQATVPTRKTTVKYCLWKPRGSGSILRTITSNCPDTAVKPDRDGWNAIERQNVPAMDKEIFQPPLLDTTSSMFIYYSEAKELPPGKFWKDYSKELHKKMQEATKPTSFVRSTLQNIILPADGADEKLRKIYDYCRTKILNRSRRTASLTKDERSKWKYNESGHDVLKAGNGGPQDINLAFAALIRAAGFEPRFLACNNRQWLCFRPSILEAFMLPYAVVAVQSGDSWRYFDPGSTYLELGFLHWRYTDTMTLLSDPDGSSEPKILHGATSESSVRARLAQLALLEDGTLEGDIVETYTGLADTSLKEELDSKSDRDREESILREFKEAQRQAEVTAFTITNVINPMEPVKISYHVRIPNYAERTGARLFMQPSVFMKGVSPLFPSENRKNKIFFRNRFMTKDEIHIKLPAGYSLEQANKPGDLDLGVLGSCATTISFKPRSNELVYTRTFRLQELIFPVKAYQGIKEAFDCIHALDGHVLTLKRNDVSAGAPNEAAAPAQH